MVWEFQTVPASSIRVQKLPVARQLGDGGWRPHLAPERPQIFRVRRVASQPPSLSSPLATQADHQRSRRKAPPSWIRSTAKANDSGWAGSSGSKP